MCFAPYISLSTFVIEFLLALFFVLKNPKDRLNQLIAFLSFLLGFYQLNEFLICLTDISVFTKLAMSTTAVLPALGLTYCLIMCRRKISWYWYSVLYSPPIFFILMFVMTGYYDSGAICNSVFVRYPDLGLLGNFYGLYYFSYILATLIIFYWHAHAAKKKAERVILHLGSLSMLIFTVPAGIFVYFLPSMYIEFPSVLCEFGLLLAIEFVVLLWYKDKHGIKY